MSVAPAPQALPAGGAATSTQPPTAAGEACPLCGSALRPEQDWCVSCGAAARTRLAAAPSWKAPIIAFAVLVVLALGVLTAALVKLAGGSPPAATVTRTVVTAPAAVTPTTGAGVPTTPTTPTTSAGTTPAGTTPTTSTPTTNVPTTSTPLGKVPGDGTTPPPGSARPLTVPRG